MGGSTDLNFVRVKYFIPAWKDDDRMAECLESCIGGKFRSLHPNKFWSIRSSHEIYGLKI